MNDDNNKTENYKEKAKQVQAAYDDFLVKLEELKKEQDKIIKDFVESVREEKIKQLKQDVLNQK